MLRKEEILERTSNGLNVFRHYITCQWRVGRNFFNPLYEDRKASCNIYFDRRNGIYKMKDFGNDEYSGDCFSFVGKLKGLDCNNANGFVEILNTINRDLSLGLSDDNSFPEPSVMVKPVSLVPTEKKPKPHSFREQNFSSQELTYWQQFGITPEILVQYKICSVKEFRSENADGNPYTLHSTPEEPMFGYKGKRHIKLYRPFWKYRWEQNYAKLRKALKKKPLTLIRGQFYVFRDCPRICQ